MNTLLHHTCAGAHLRRRSTHRARVCSVCATAGEEAPSHEKRALLFGCTRTFGASLVSRLVARGWAVTAVCHRASSQPGLAAAGASSVLCGDATDDAFVHSCFAVSSPGVVVCAAASSRGAAKTACDTAERAASAVLDAALWIGTVKRFVLISALGAGDSLECVPAISREPLRLFLSSKEAAEARLRAVGGGAFEWVVLRPGPLEEGEGSGRPVATLDAASGKAFSPLSRAALAQVCVDAMLAPNAGGRVLSILDAGAVVVATPQLRGVEPWEEPPFVEYVLDT